MLGTIRTAMIAAVGVTFWIGAGSSPGRVADRAASQPARQVKTDLGGGVTMELVLIPAGQFKMGSSTREFDRDTDEEQHEVTLSRPFYLGSTEVTQEQYAAVMGGNPSKFKGEKNPVEKVTWPDAVEFCRKLSEKSGQRYRLPTEAEWEYACRAGSTTPFNTGETLDAADANYDGNYVYGDGRKGAYRQKTMPAGNFRPNAWGLYDMHGNVIEWCQDWFQAYPSRAVIDPKPDSDEKVGRAQRGGSWGNEPATCRSANRIQSEPDISSSQVGFRVCRDVS